MGAKFSMSFSTGGCLSATLLCLLCCGIFASNVLREEYSKYPLYLIYFLLALTWYQLVATLYSEYRDIKICPKMIICFAVGLGCSVILFQFPGLLAQACGFALLQVILQIALSTIFADLNSRDEAQDPDFEG
ncbi:MAG TPA: hypothetical protein VEK08_10480 [Planctomycetota bacterium]|nr:hypothetical protein [Planctomycetota bacterium]